MFMCFVGFLGNLGTKKWVCHECNVNLHDVKIMKRLVEKGSLESLDIRCFIYDSDVGGITDARDLASSLQESCPDLVLMV